jgi:hypothetical protein
MTIFYPDVSDYQAGISFAGCVIAMVKATEDNDYTNPDYAAAKVPPTPALISALIISCTQAMAPARRHTPMVLLAAEYR